MTAFKIYFNCEIFVTKLWDFWENSKIVTFEGL